MSSAVEVSAIGDREDAVHQSCQPVDRPAFNGHSIQRPGRTGFRIRRTEAIGAETHARAVPIAMLRNLVIENKAVRRPRRLLIQTVGENTSQLEDTSVF